MNVMLFGAGRSRCTVVSFQWKQLPAASGHGDESSLEDAAKSRVVKKNNELSIELRVIILSGFVTTSDPIHSTCLHQTHGKHTDMD